VDGRINAAESMSFPSMTTIGALICYNWRAYLLQNGRGPVAGGA